MKKISLVFWGVIIGFLIFILMYGFKTLNIFDNSWLIDRYIDIDSVTGYFLFKSFLFSEIQIPFLVTNFNFPNGVPFFENFIYGLIGLLLNFKKFETIQLSGLIVLISFILQAVSTLFLLSLFIQNKLVLIISDILFCLSPTMIVRSFKHDSLTNHWFIIISLYLYFRTKKESSFPWLFTLLLPFSFLIHAYFFPMVFAIYFISLIEYFFKKKSFQKIFLSLFMSFFITLFSIYIMGYFDYKGLSVSSIGYGFYSVNLLSFFNPLDWNGLNWSAFLPSMSLGQTEAFSYFGMGIIVSIIFIFIYLIKEIRDNKNVKTIIYNFVNKYILLIMMSVLLFFYSTFNDLFLIYNFFPKFVVSFLNIFRSSGRFIWPVYYLIYLVIIIFIYKKYPKKAFLLIFFVVVVQIIDLYPGIKSRRDHLYDKPINSYDLMDGEIWSFVANSYRGLNVLNNNRSVDLFCYLSNYNLITNWSIGSDAYMISRKSDLELKYDKDVEFLKNGVFNSSFVYLTTDKDIMEEIRSHQYDKFYFIETKVDYYEGYSEVSEGTFKLILPKNGEFPEKLKKYLL